jgi:hypothetical protein
MQRFLDPFISINCSTCFRRFLGPSSGAQNSTYSVRYCQTSTAACCYRGWDWASLNVIWRRRPQLHTQASSISSTIAAGGSIGLTITDAVLTVLCSLWWAEETPETYKAIYRNKWIEKTLHLVGCTLEIQLQCMDIWTSKKSDRFLLYREWSARWENNGKNQIDSLMFLFRFVGSRSKRSKQWEMTKDQNSEHS